MGPWAWARLVSSVIHPCPSPLGLFFPWFTVNPSLQLPSLFTGSQSQEVFFILPVSLDVCLTRFSVSPCSVLICLISPLSPCFSCFGSLVLCCSGTVIQPRGRALLSTWGDWRRSWGRPASCLGKRT